MAALQKILRDRKVEKTYMSQLWRVDLHPKLGGSTTA